MRTLHAATGPRSQRADDLPDTGGPASPLPDECYIPTAASCTVPNLVGIKIDRLAAEEVFQRALRLARSEANLPEEWEKRTAQIANAKSQTFTPALGTALLAKATDRRVDALSLQASGSHKSYSARGLAKEVLVPQCKIAGIDIRTTGAEPLNNQPFFGESSIRESLKVKKGTEGELRFLCDSLREADFLENEPALAAFAAFLRSRIKATGELEQVGIEARPLAMARLVDSVTAFVTEHSEGGRVGQAIVAAILDLVHKDVRTRKVNDPGRGWSGDVGAFVDGRVSLSVEVKQRPVSESEVLQFIDRLGTDHVPRGVVAALAQGGVPLDADRVAESAQRYGLALDIVLGVRRLLLDVIRHIPGDPHEAMALLPNLGLKRLKGIEASEEVQRAWVEATTE